MTPQHLADIHHAAFPQERAWSADEFESLLDSTSVALFHRPHGFALTRTIAGESELLTLAVAPAFHRQGLGRALMLEWLATLEGASSTAFLEVAADNTAAGRLYRNLGFAEVGRRTAYYARKNMTSVDAIVMAYKVT
ncbi:GNAT family N-acetyltransferase [Sulfitobacter sp. F26204]|uniref:GNAT family N-acetyltransferase n=1 Tax=Sulfitobacter sp. F26204 TaxID=2996014 RepID=UPI00225E3549|nr:GNAT family N-acetyltransferase [Sulfitobacter sp. F26204]MCX7561067.1 GNAT family N-acetyltransferase [Sulfitobacter sp. F26204]